MEDIELTDILREYIDKRDDISEDDKESFLETALDVVALDNDMSRMIKICITAGLMYGSRRVIDTLNEKRAEQEDAKRKGEDNED
jgi:hypothetical protein